MINLKIPELNKMWYQSICFTLFYHPFPIPSRLFALILVNNVVYLRQFATGMSALMVCAFCICTVVGDTLRSWGWHLTPLGCHSTSALQKFWHFGNQPQMLCVCHLCIMPAPGGVSSSCVTLPCSRVGETMSMGVMAFPW